MGVQGGVEEGLKVSVVGEVGSSLTTELFLKSSMLPKDTIPRGEYSSHFF